MEFQNVSSQLPDYTVLHSRRVKASTSSVSFQNTKYHQDIFHIFRQNMQTDGGRDKTPIMHSLKQMTKSLTSPVFPSVRGLSQLC